VWSANQRQVAGDYPWYIGTTSNFFDPGYRANEINRFLSQDKKFSATDMMALQTDTRDYLASEIVPALLQALNGAQLPGGGDEDKALAALSVWDYHMDVDSTAASIWSMFWQEYLSQTFDPWWKSHNVKVDRSEVDDALGQDLEAWTLRDQTNPAFTLVGSAQNAQDVMRQSFEAAVKLLAERLGPDTKTWTWGRIHERTLENLAQIHGLDYGPVPDRGDSRTPLAAPDFPSTHGPSWRMVVDWGARTFMGIYPGGQAENPVSHWYTDRAQAWFDGRYAPMLEANAAAHAPAAVTWSIDP
jgi:penicillin G amidase